LYNICKNSHVYFYSQEKNFNYLIKKMKMRRLLATLTIASVVLMSGCKKDEYPATVGVCPVVVSTIPADKAVGVPINQVVSATFNEKMDPAAFTQETFTLSGTTTIAGTKAASVVTGVVTFSDMTAFFTPASPLAPNTTYTGTIKAGVKDLKGNALQVDHVWSFSTDVAPAVTADPINNAVDVPLAKVIIATFSVPMDTLTLKAPATTIIVKQGTTIIPGRYSFTTTTASFTPSVALSPFTIYTLTITTAAKNTLGTPLATDYVWSFTTIPQINVSALPVLGGTVAGGGTFAQGSSVTVTATPKTGYSFTNWTEGVTIVSTNASYQLNMAGNKTLVANFATGTSTFALNTTGVNGTVAKLPNTATYNSGATVVLTPTPATGFVFTSWSGDATGTANPLTVTMNANKNITANFTAIPVGTFTLNVTALNGTVVKNPSLVSYANGATVQLTATPATGFIFTSWSGDATGSVSPVTVTMNGNKNVTANFTAAVHAGPLNINLGSAGDFAVLGGSGVSNTGVTTRIIGDVGSFPTATIDGLLAGNVNGILYMTADPIVGQAKIDLTTAYNDGQARSLNAISLPGQLGGLTLAPGLYVNSSTSGISGTGSNAILTLDAQGDANAVWIFKMGSTFVTDAGTSIVLAGGAQAKNIYWSVGTSATLGTNSIFYGNILADQAITLTTGATLYGRALTRVAAVTIDSSIITKP
jgi:uncharacterized repeat protein (TIGR02543 family)